ncbi:aminotransferase class V-fold PLP-dependent enzyme [Candidatus Chlamydia sanziniae]|uniref:Nitrogen fixation protein n=1 Tax=Candidatus Chlamydia sanziniae TaxID=1806891 RepID=A0A1A9HVD6_9CHLA|nr:aminotransferase class V-fold PLP-dependent enzyme [Candidatus Chlamydia sanziniae]ANH78657.1 nitrogen fixation protein [Candidatus Chlamydia sanziniae]
MEKPQIRKISRTLWLNNQQAIPPSEKVKDSYASYADLFSLMPSSALRLLREAEEDVRKLVGVTSSHMFHFVPHFPHIVRIIVSALLENSSVSQGRNHLILPTHDQQLFIDGICRRQGLAATYDWVTANHEGRIVKEHIIETLNSRTLLFSLSAAHGMLGVIQPIEQILNQCNDRGVLLHLDISDILGRAPLTPPMLEADIITFSATALGGIGSLGGMFIHKSLEPIFTPWFPEHRAGHLCFGSIAAMQTACQERFSALPLFTFNTLNLRKQLIQELKQACPSIQILFPEMENSLPNIFVAAIPNFPAESLAFLLHQQGIYPGLGYERFQSLAQVLQNCGVPPVLCHNALHFALTERSKDLNFAILTRALNASIKHLTPLLIHSP